MEARNFYSRGFYFKVIGNDGESITYSAIKVLPMWLIKLFYKSYTDE